MLAEGSVASFAAILGGCWPQGLRIPGHGSRFRRIAAYVGERQDARGEMAGGGSGALKTGRMQGMVHDGLDALVDGPYGEVAASLL